MKYTFNYSFFVHAGRRGGVVYAGGHSSENATLEDLDKKVEEIVEALYLLFGAPINVQILGPGKSAVMYPEGVHIIEITRTKPEST